MLSMQADRADDVDSPDERILRLTVWDDDGDPGDTIWLHYTEEQRWSFRREGDGTGQITTIANFQEIDEVVQRLKNWGLDDGGFSHEVIYRDVAAEMAATEAGRPLLDPMA